MCLINNIEILFLSLSVSMVLFGILMNLFEPYLPVLITKSFRYGKFANTQDSKIVKKFECPKSYFKHFYKLGIIVSSFTLILMIRIYLFNYYETDKWLISVLDYISGCEERKSTVSKSHAFVAMILITLQCFRRFYDTHFVSVFGTKSTMNLVHYLVGIIYYPAIILAVISEAPDFTNSGKSSGISLDKTEPFDLKVPSDYIAILLFLWAWWHQHSTTVILANLRKNKKGDVISESHKLPHGDWFEYLSSPHSIAEILMYTSLTWLLITNRTWWTVYFWVLSNQIETTLLSHWWYKSTFKNFPSKRKALIPFIY